MPLTDEMFLLRQVELNEPGPPSVVLAASSSAEKLKTYALEYECEQQQLETEEDEIRLAGEVQWLESPDDRRVLLWMPASMPDIEYQISPVHVV